MREPVRPTQVMSASTVILSVAWLSASMAVQVPDPKHRFDDLILADPATSIDVAATPVGSLPGSDRARIAWDGFRAAHGRDWSVYFDRRSGAPLLVEGKGIPWPGMEEASVASLAASLRTFMASRRSLFLANDAELVLDEAASGPLADDVWQIVFRRVVLGIPVAGQRYLFTIGHGHLISFGTPRWSRIEASPVPDVTAVEARGRLSSYMKLTASDTVNDFGGPTLEFIPLRATAAQAGATKGRYAGAFGSGYASALVWRIALRVEGEVGTWVGRVDAHTGAILSFADDDKYTRVKGGVYPVANDQLCPSGCEQQNYSMPFADIAINTVPQPPSSSMGNFPCSTGNIAKTTLNGPFVKILDSCGAISQAASCAVDLNLGASTGTDCTVPAGTSAGNTHASRTSFHHVNRIAEHARTWLPSVGWLTQQLTVMVNAAGQCVGGWDGVGIFLGITGTSCSNAAESAGVLYHEWGHGLDQNDGGDYDIPTEAYADVTSIMLTHASCVARGFVPASNCTSYGDTCLNCTGSRDMDWDQHVSHTPATPADFLVNHCADAGDGGPCGKEQHCEGHVAGEAMWDLGARDLAASGLDAISAWAVADRLWYKSRLGSGGNAYNCALPDSDGCSATSWFEKIRAVDDDDGNLANGTPHAAAIFAAFDRHKIACGAASDPGNQNSGTCAALGAPVLTAVPNSTPATGLLSWTTVPGAVSYRVLRNDRGCQAALTRLTTTSENSLIDTDLTNGIPVYYSVHAMASNEACDGGLSSCQPVTPQPFAGVIGLSSSIYGCSSTITVTVTDANGAASLTAALTSTTEAVAETVTLTKIAPGSKTYRGTIATTIGAPASDGLLSVRDGDTITARYVDANDGGGGVNLVRVTTATASCAAGAARPVADGSFGTAMRASRANVFGSTLNVTWDVVTCVSADHHILYGALADVAAATVTGASCNLGASGAASWTGVPAGSLWFVVVGDDNASTEGSWGTLGAGVERGGVAVSGLCGMLARNNSATCP